MSAIPEAHQPVMPYLILNNAEKFLEFSQEVFNARLNAIHKNEDGSIMHAEVQIEKCTIMFSEATETWKPSPGSFFIYVKDADASFNKAVEKGSSVIMEPENKDYGRTCGVKDPTSNIWWITSIPV